MDLLKGLQTLFCDDPDQVNHGIDAGHGFADTFVAGNIADQVAGARVQAEADTGRGFRAANRTRQTNHMMTGLE